MIMNKEIELLKLLIKEELIKLGDDQFQLSPDEVEELKTHLDAEMGKKPFDPMKRSGSGDKRKIDAIFAEDSDWKNWMKKLGYPEEWEGGEAPEGVLISPDKMQKLYFSLYELAGSTFAAKYIDHVLDALYSADPTALGNDLFSLDSPPESIEVPSSMTGLADINTAKGGGKGSETGRGEFVVPFLFRDGEMGGANAEHDVSIGGTGWHVKELDSMTQSIRLGKNTYAGSPTGDLLKSEVGMKASELSWNGAKETAVLKNLQQPVADPSKKSIMDALEIDDPAMALEELQKRLNSDMRDLGIGTAAGVLFLVKGTLYFIPKDKCVCGGATQSAHRVAMPAGANGENGPFAAKSSQVKVLESYYNEKQRLQDNANQIVRAQNNVKPSIRRLISESFSSQEKDEIARVASKTLDEKWKKELMGKVEKLLEKQAKGFFKNDHFYKATADVWKQLMRVYAEDQFQYARRYTRYDVPLAKYRP